MKYFCDYNLLNTVPTVLLHHSKQYVLFKQNPKYNVKEYVIRTKSRSSTVLPFFEHVLFKVYNGKKYINVSIKKNRFFLKLGEFSFTKVICRHNRKKKKGR